MLIIILNLFFLYSVPPSSLSIIPSHMTVYAGSFLTINCSIELNDAIDSRITVTAIWKRNNNLLNNQTHRTVRAAVSNGNSLYLSQIIFNPVQLGSDDGLYSCEIRINPEEEFVMNSTVFSRTVSVSAIGMIIYECRLLNIVICALLSIVVPTLMATIIPEASSILDMAPFNVFNLRCTVVVPDGVFLLKTFQWQEEGNAINDNGNSVLISHINVTMPQSFSELTVSSPSVGRHRYTCIVSISVPNGENLLAQASGVVTVRGMLLDLCLCF